MSEDLTQTEKTLTGCFIILLGVVLFLFIAVVLTGLYLALKNWG